MQTDTHITSSETIVYSKAKSFFKLTKFTLSALVVFSAIITFFTVAETYNWKQVLAICLGGFLVTAAANGFNQIIEKFLKSEAGLLKNPYKIKIYYYKRH